MDDKDRKFEEVEKQRKEMDEIIQKVMDENRDLLKRLANS